MNHLHKILGENAPKVTIKPYPETPMTMVGALVPSFIIHQFSDEVRRNCSSICSCCRIGHSLNLISFINGRPIFWLWGIVILILDHTSQILFLIGSISHNRRSHTIDRARHAQKQDHDCLSSLKRIALFCKYSSTSKSRVSAINFSFFGRRTFSNNVSRWLELENTYRYLPVDGH